MDKLSWYTVCMENLSYNAAEELREEVLKDLPWRVRRKLSGTAISVLNREETEKAFGVALFVEKSKTAEKVSKHIPEDKRDNVEVMVMGEVVAAAEGNS